MSDQKNNKEWESVWECFSPGTLPTNWGRVRLLQDMIEAGSCAKVQNNLSVLLMDSHAKVVDLLINYHVRGVLSFNAECIDAVINGRNSEVILHLMRAKVFKLTESQINMLLKIRDEKINLMLVFVYGKELNEDVVGELYSSSHSVRFHVVQYCNLSDAQIMETLQAQSMLTLALLESNSFMPNKKQLEFIEALDKTFKKYLEKRIPSIEANILKNEFSEKTMKTKATVL